MIQPSENKSFSAQDIERYHAGTLPAAERHALERAALDDPFLADALEGYALAATPAADLEALRNRLAARLEDRKVRPLFAGRRSWLSAAALVIVLAGAAFLAVRVLQPDARNVAAEKVPPPAVQINQLTLDSISSNPSSSLVAAPAADSAQSMNFSQVQTPDRKTADAGNNDDAAPARGRMEAHSNMNALVLTDTNRYSSSFATAPKADDRAKETELKGLVNGNNNAGYVPNTSANAKFGRSDTVSNFNVTMKPLNNQRTEEVTLSKRPANVAAMQRSRLEGIRIDTLEPVEGWVRFDDYIASNLKTPEEIKSKPENSGAVVLAFDVNKEGEAVNITVVQSLCTRCDEEAIRLLKDGPKWKKKKGRGRVTIHF